MAHFAIYRLHDQGPPEAGETADQRAARLGRPESWVLVDYVTDRLAQEEAQVVRETVTRQGRYRAVRFDRGNDYLVQPPVPEATPAY